MASTVAERSSARRNRPHVRLRPVQPSLDGGKPIDDAHLGFEGAFDGLVAEGDDATALELCVIEVRRVGSIQAMTETRCIATRTVTDHDAHVLRLCRKHLSRVLDHAKERAARLRAAAIPEEQRICAELDGRIEDRVHFGAPQ